MKKLEVKIVINTTPNKVISAFTEPTMLKAWWQVEKTLIETKVEGLYILAWAVTEKSIGYVSSGIIKEYINDKLLIIENFVYMNPEKPFLGPMTLTIKAVEKNRITQVYLCQDGYQKGADWGWYYEAVKDAWPNVMQTLKNYLEKKSNKKKII